VEDILNSNRNSRRVQKNVKNGKSEAMHKKIYENTQETIRCFGNDDENKEGEGSSQKSKSKLLFRGVQK
jgi:hypothetical protein